MNEHPDLLDNIVTGDETCVDVRSGEQAAELRMANFFFFPTTP